MIAFLHDLPAGVVGIDLKGEVTKEEYDRVYPEVEKMAETKDEINYLIKVETPLKNITAGVWWDDFKLALKHFRKWRKIAIVTDEKAIDTLADTFGFAYPGESRTFTLAQYQDAVNWIAA